MNCIFRYLINESVFIIDSSGPISGKSVLQRLRFINTFKRIPLCFFDESIDTAEGRAYTWERYWGSIMLKS